MTEQELINQIQEDLNYKMSILPPVIIPEWQKQYMPKLHMVNIHSTSRGFNAAIKRKNDIYFNNIGYQFRILEYIDCNNVIIEFLNTGYRTSVKVDSINRGSIRDPFERSVYNVGYLGIGPYKSTINYDTTKQYETWSGMMHRCYDILTLMRSPSYSKVIVDPIWHNYQNFALWFDNNYYELPNNEKLSLDKDLIPSIIGMHNKIYSPNTSCLLPININIAMHLGTKDKAYSTPTGVRYIPSRVKPYLAMLDLTNEARFLGYYTTKEEAFDAYKTEKQNYIYYLAEKYKYIIPDYIYQLLMQYKINDIIEYL
jgi:hypothetical protein